MTLTPVLLLLIKVALLNNVVPAPSGVDGLPVTRPVPIIEEPTLPDRSDWLYLGRFPIRFYGPRFHEGRPTASTLPYRPDARIASIGREALARVRQLAGDSSRLRKVCITREGPCYTWGFQMRIADPKGRHQLEVTVEDTGAGDGIDLPDATWRLFGYPPSQGVFWGDVWVRLR